MTTTTEARMRALEWGVLGLAVLMLGVIALHMVVFPYSLNHDAALYLDIGERVLDGQRPYVDYQESNFPLIHALNVVPVGLARLLGVSSAAVLCAIMLGLVAWAAWGTRAVLLSFWPDRRGLAAVLAALVILTSAWSYFHYIWAEREHLFMLAVVPWFILRVARRSGLAPRTGQALVWGFIAAAATAIKPHFALIVLLPELYGALVQRRLFVRAPEIYAVAGFFGLYGLYFALNPDVLAGFLPLIERLQTGYGSYYSLPVAVIVAQQPVVYGFLALAAGVLVVTRPARGAAPLNLLMPTLACALLGAVLVFLIQQKGWGYHRLPADFLAMFILGLGAYGLDVRGRGMVRWAWRGVVAIGVGVLAMDAYAYGWRKFEADTRSAAPLVAQLAAHSQPRDWILLIDSSVMPGYPTLPIERRRNASRYAFAFPVPFAYYADPSFDRFGVSLPPDIELYITHLQADLALHQPSMVIVRLGVCTACPPGLTMDDVLRRGGFFDSAAMQAYQPVSSGDGAYLYFVRTPSAPDQTGG